jgi:hypothetical protein
MPFAVYDDQSLRKYTAEQPTGAGPGYGKNPDALYELPPMYKPPVEVAAAQSPSELEGTRRW